MRPGYVERMWLLLTGPGWRSPPVRLALRARDRFAGQVEGSGTGVLLWTRSVHGRGRRRPLEVAFIDACGRVTGHTRLAPGRMVWRRRPCWMLELPQGHPPAPTGPVQAHRILGEWPAD